MEFCIVVIAICSVVAIGIVCDTIEEIKKNKK